MRCLVVEDDADIRGDLQRTLEAAGFAVDAVGDGERAWFQGDVEDYAVAIRLRRSARHVRVAALTRRPVLAARRRAVLSRASAASGGTPRDRPTDRA